MSDNVIMPHSGADVNQFDALAMIFVAGIGVARREK
jgi:hypothetical protein